VCELHSGTRLKGFPNEGFRLTCQRSFTRHRAIVTKNATGLSAIRPPALTKLAQVFCQMSSISSGSLTRLAMIASDQHGVCGGRCAGGATGHSAQPKTPEPAEVAQAPGLPVVANGCHHGCRLVAHLWIVHSKLPSLADG
jgi:hypothetical protein